MRAALSSTSRSSATGCGCTWPGRRPHGAGRRGEGAQKGGRGDGTCLAEQVDHHAALAMRLPRNGVCPLCPCSRGFRMLPDCVSDLDGCVIWDLWSCGHVRVIDARSSEILKSPQLS